MEQDLEFQGRMLRVARQARHLTQQQLATATGITQPFISLIEEGERSPSSEQIQKFSVALDFRVRFFYQTDVISGPGVGEIYHRRKKMTQKDLDHYYAWTNIKMMAARKMIQAVEWPDCSLPSLSLGNDVATEEEAAAYVRARLYIPRGPIASISNVLDEAGVLVIPEVSEHKEMDGSSIWRSDSPPMIFVNEGTTQDRMRMTLAHELGHLVLHQRSILRQVSAEIEEEAFRFASAFLMPADEIKPQLRNLNLTKLADLKMIWRVAMSAIVMRAKQLAVIAPERATELWRELSKRGWMKREPEQLDVRGEQPGGLYQELVNLHSNELGYRGNKFADLLILDGEDVTTHILPPSMAPRLRIVG